MSVLLLQLSGPLQSWGDSSRFVRRLTRREPTKSGVVGLLAAACGRLREESVDDLAKLEFGVRTDQAGKILRDFQTEQPETGKAMPLSYRYYLADAKFLVALGGSADLLTSLDAALREPRWPLYLGRRACPADPEVSLGIHNEYEDIREALLQYPWLASEWYQKRYKETIKNLEVAFDARKGEGCDYQTDYPIGFSVKRRDYQTDYPIGFSVKRRDYRNRAVLHGFVSMKNISSNVSDNDEEQSYADNADLREIEADSLYPHFEHNPMEPLS